MNDHHTHFTPEPSRMSEDAFVARFGGVYERSPWVARQAWQQGLGAAQNSVEGLATVFAHIVDTADPEVQHALILAHPDLGGRAAVRGELSAESAREQAGAGLDQCTPEEFERLQQLNSAYREKFGFPFIMAVKGRQRREILAAMARRLDNNAACERRQALAEIHKIARLRLRELARAAPTGA